MNSGGGSTNISLHSTGAVGTAEEGLSVRAEADWMGDGVGGGKEKRGSKISDMGNWVKDGQSHMVGIEVLPTH